MNKRWLWVPLLLMVAGCGYNRIQVLDEQVKKTRGNIDTELQEVRARIRQVFT